jgi:hypothetical protein
MDSDLARFRGIKTGEEFLRRLDTVIDENLTGDYWTITLPANLESSSARNPELFAFIAAQNLLDAPVLFSNKKVAHLIDPALRPKRKPLERHHLFPRAYLEANGIGDRRLVNQMANYALLEWPDNLDIRDTAPSVYVPTIRERFDDATWERMRDLHGLPQDWEQMDYDAFLAERRRRMATIIRRGFEALR